MVMDEERHNRLAEELESLKEQIAALQEAFGQISASTDIAHGGSRPTEQEIEAAMGLVPPFLATALDAPELLKCLWSLTKSSFVENPLPAIFKEKMAARLARRCTNPSALLAHICRLARLGLTAREILGWLEEPVPAGESDLENSLNILAEPGGDPDAWPEAGSPREKSLLRCCLLVATTAGRADCCHRALLSLLGRSRYRDLMILLDFCRFQVLWMNSRAEKASPADERLRADLATLLPEQPGLDRLLRDSPPESGWALPSPTTAGADERLFFEGLVAGGPDGIFTFDRQGIIQIWNAEMARIFGLSSEQATGRPCFEIFGRITDAGEDLSFLETLQGKTADLANRPYRKPGEREPGYFEGRFVPVIGREGDVQGGVGILRDITARRHADEQRLATEARYLDLFENANDMVYTLDLRGNITSLNKAAERITGYSSDDALRMNFLDFAAPGQREAASRALERQVSREGPATDELEIVTREGKRAALEISTHPILRDGTVIGVQGIARDITERKRTEEALQQAKQNLEAWVEELEKRTREMTLLSEMGDLLRACLTTDEVYTVIVRVAQQIFPVQVGALYVISPSRNLVEAVAVWGDATRVERVFSPEECWALRRGRVHWVEDTGVGLLCRHLHHPHPDGYLCVPMMAQSEALGVLHLTEPATGRLSEANQRLAVAMAEHIAMALSNLKLHETLRNQAIRDPVTGIFNRRFMEESLELELRRAARSQCQLGIIMIELDHAPAFYATFGRETGNTVLVELSALIQTCIRKEDIVCRFGNEKFVLLMPMGNIEVTRDRASVLRDRVKFLEIKHREQVLGNFTVSMGVAAFPEHGRTVQALLQATDAALQRARNEGGDRLITAH